MNTGLKFVFAILLAAFFFSGSLARASAKDLPQIFGELDANPMNEGALADLKAYVDANMDAFGTDEGLLRLARTYVKRKDFDRANDSYEMLIDGFPASRFRPDAFFELGGLRLRVGRTNDAKALFEYVLSSETSTIAIKARVRKVLADMKASSVIGPNTPAIGLLLPLSGNYMQYAEDALSGALLAAEVFGGKTADVELIVRNVAADTASVESAVTELSANGRVVALVGPLLSSSVLETARYAQKKKIPVITLSQRDGVTDAGDYVFRNFLTLPAQADAVAAYAVRTLGKKRFAVLYPQNNYGSEMTKLFEMAVRKYGGDVVRQVPYPNGNTDFSIQMKQAFGVEVKEHAEGRRRIKEYNPTVRADALFIPDSYETVSLITPYIDYYNIKGVQLLGSSVWNSPQLPRLADKSVEGAVFVDGFFPESSRVETAEFTRLFKEVYGRTPGVIEAQAYDAVKMIITLVGENSGSLDRSELKTHLRALKNYRGITGNISFDGGGEAVKKLFLLTVIDGRIVEVPGN